MPCGNDYRDFQPVWTIIDAINKQAKLKAAVFAQRIHQELSDTNSEPEDTSLDLLQEEIENLIVDDDAVLDLTKSMQQKKKDKKKIEIKRRHCSQFLRRFVARHIFEMLKRLYNQIEVEEKKMNLILGFTDEDLSCATATVKKFPDTSRAETSGQIEEEKLWYAALYSTTAGISIVGPVGERPLHVCALLAHRFEHVDQKMFGNFMSEGIFQGMMHYINLSDKCFKEATTQYSKDYCAAAGSFLLTKITDPARNSLPFLSARNSLPFLSQICKWKKAHMRPRLFQCCGVVAPKRIARYLISTGIYEGETIIFPLIAGRNEEIIRALFKKDRKNQKPISR